MRTKRIELCEPGNILCSDVLFNSGNILYPKGTILTTVDIGAIQNAGIRQVEICSNQLEVKELSKFDLKSTSDINHNMSLASTITDNIKKSIDYTVINPICEELDRHQYNVAILTALVLNVTTKFIGMSKYIVMGALLHDIGKTILPDEVLYAQRKLTDEERKIINNHSIIGYNMLKSLGFNDTVCDIARQHHEAMDGSGYPDHLEYEQISYGSKIVHIADVYESMCADRCYRAPMERMRIRSIMFYEERKYDSSLMEVFMREVPLYMINDVLAYKNRLYKVVGYTEERSPLLVDILSNKEYDLSELNPAFIEAAELKLK